jgi:hypothetical protein
MSVLRLYSVGDRMTKEYGGMRIGRGNRSTRRKSSPVSLVRHKLTWARTPVAADIRVPVSTIRDFNLVVYTSSPRNKYPPVLCTLAANEIYSIVKILSIVNMSGNNFLT